MPKKGNEGNFSGILVAFAPKIERGPAAACRTIRQFLQSRRAAPQTLMIEGTVIGFDFGEKRIGVAVGSTLTGSSRPLCIIHAGAGRQDKWEAVAALVREWDPAAFVVGLPVRLDDTAEPATLMALNFAKRLYGRTKRPVFMTDERFSSVVVDDGTGAFDDKSAAVILQQWFDEGCPQRAPNEIEITQRR